MTTEGELRKRARPGARGDQQVVLALLFGVALAAGGATPRAPIQVGRCRQLMLDDALFESLDGLARIVNQPVKCHDNPVVTYDRPWEGNCVILWGSVLYDQDEKQFKMWYETYKKFPPAG